MKAVVDVRIGRVDASGLNAAVDAIVARATASTVGKTVSSVGGSQVDRKFVSESTSALLTYSAIERPLNEAFVKLSKGLEGAMKSAGLGAAAGGLGAILQLVLGEALDELVRGIQSIVKLLLFVAPPFLGVLLKIFDVLSAFWDGFRNVGKVWGAILSSISRMVEPFANLLIPLMLPFLYMFTAIGRVLNLMLLPVFTAMMKAFSEAGQQISTLILNFAENPEALFEALGDVINAFLVSFGKAFDAVRERLTQTLMPLFDALAAWIASFLTLDLGKVHEVVNNLFGNQLGSVVNKLIDVFYYAASAIMGFVAQIVGKDLFNQIFGVGQFEKIAATNKGFEAAANVAKLLQEIWGQLNDWVVRLRENPIGTIWNTLTEALSSIAGALKKLFFGVGTQLQGTESMWEKFKAGSAVTPTLETGLTKPPEETLQEIFVKEGLIGAINKLVEDFSGFNVTQFWTDILRPALQSLVDAIKNAMIDAFGEDGKGGAWNDLIDALGDKNSGVIGALTELTQAINVAKNRIPALLRAAILGFLVSGIPGAMAAAATSAGAGMTEEQTDFISRPGQRATRFSSSDTIVGIKNPSMLGGNTVTVINNIQGNGDQFLENKIRVVAKQVFEQENARTSRTGFYQLGR
ncbi:MAG: hypothetical protein M0R66_01340 [Candidatus Omnitrophica bacterium]|nr:hypothetical protein [Candidatus Omnitrophota bacterium]